MKVQNMTSPRTGKPVANQFVITGMEGKFNVSIFQSYNSVICKVVDKHLNPDKVYLDSKFWDYSVTTGKYRNQFLGETKAETQKKIDSGEYVLTDLN